MHQTCPVKNTIVVTKVSPIYWIDLDGTTSALAAGPSIIELTKPEANAIVMYLVLLRTTVDESIRVVINFVAGPVISY